MRKFFAIVYNELYRYFVSPVSVVYVLTFLFLNASFTLYLGHFLERGQASLDMMFGFMPWIYLIFISGISMRLWSEEFKSKTITQLLTLPINLTQAVWGKFVAAWIFCSLGLLLTGTFVITVNILGTPDNGVIIAGYLACFLLSGAMLAVSQTMSALTSNQVIALILAIIANLLFFLGGMEYVLQFYRNFLPFQIVENLAQLSFLTHFAAISSGDIGIYDILFFISVIVVFNILTEIIIKIKVSSSAFLYSAHRYLSGVFFILVLWLGFAGFNILAHHFLNTQHWDMTKDKIYTLPDAAENILHNITEPVTIKVYYSPVLSQRNPLFRQAIDYLTTLLKTYQQTAEDKLSYRFYYPQFLNEAEDMAIQDKMTPIPLPDLNQTAFFGISLVDEGGRQQTIPLIALENFEKIGFDILQNIHSLTQKKTTVGILSSLPLFGLKTAENQVSNSWQIIEEMRKTYNLKQIKEATDLQNIAVLVLIHPQNLSKEMTMAIENYTLDGGKILLLADIAAEAERLYSPVNHRLSPSQLNGLDNLWGFQFKPEQVIADLDNSLTVNTGTKEHAAFAQDVIEFSLKDNFINRTQVETKNLSSLLFASASPITPVKGRDVTFISLLTSSKNSALMPSWVVYNNLNPADILAQFQSDNEPKVIAAKIISNQPEHPFTVVVIGDSDWLYDDFWNQFKMLEEHKYLVYLNDNANFFMNALDSLSNQNALIELRKNTTQPPYFEAWEKLRKQNAQTVALKERNILQKINDIKIQLNNLWQKKNFEERQDFSDDELTVLADFRKSLHMLKQQLSDLRIYQNANLEQKKNFVIVFNLYTLPILLLLLLLIVTFAKRTKAKYVAPKNIHFNIKIFSAVIGCFVLFSAGVIVVLTSHNPIDEYEGKPVFADWQDQLNQIQKITLKHQQTELTFYKKDGLWTLKDYEQYPLYQRRIINLLATLANARYLEKKSARAEFLPKFGLDSQSATMISLQDGKGTSLLNFAIGNYDTEIGRGGRGAYLKFPNRFQVWLIDADFISLSTDWRDWTLNKALDVRFGRVLATDKEMSDEVLLLLLKSLLNMPLTYVSTTPDNLISYDSIHLTFENQDDMTIYFDKSDDKTYVHYGFGKTDGAYLKLFAEYMRNHYYEVPAQNMEKVEDVLMSLR